MNTAALPVKFYMLTVNGRESLMLGAVAVPDPASGKTWIISRRTGEKVMEVSPDAVRELTHDEAENELKAHQEAQARVGKQIKTLVLHTAPPARPVNPRNN